MVAQVLPPNAASRVLGRVPVPRTDLVGREDEIAEIGELLSRARIVTLTGPGGSGKTRLAIAVTSRPETVTETQACWVELASLGADHLVGEMVGGAVGVPTASSGPLVPAIADRIESQDLLLVLDNCEHLAMAVTDLADYLLDACPRLRMLATSREPLGLDGEQVRSVQPLSLPPVGARDLPAAVAASPACRLFEERSRAVLPGFALGADNASAVARVCHRLEGLPLAIELAAARMRVMSLAQIDAGLNDVFHLLVGGTRTAPARHQTLRATLDWSHDLLSDGERAVFRRLGVFPGAFDLDAAESVAAGGSVNGVDVLDLLSHLVDRSLVTVRHSGDRVRYRLLATVRPYAREKLREAGESDSVSRAHLRHYADLVCAVEPRLTGPDQSRELDGLELEGNNLRVALGYARERGVTADGMRLAANLWRLCYLRGHYREGREWLDWAATVDPDGPPEVRAKAFHGGGALAFLQCDYPAAVRRLDASLLLYRTLGDEEGTALVLQTLGSVSREQGRYARAAELHRESMRLFRALGNRLGEAQAHGYLGFNAWLQCCWEEAAAECGRALAEFRRLGDTEGTAWALISLGTVAQYQGSLDQAAALLTEARRLAEGAGYPEGVAWSLHELGLLAVRRGESDAHLLLLESLSLHRDLGDRWRVTSVLEDLAACATGAGHAERAAALLGAADAIRTSIETELAPCERRDHERVEAQLRSWLGDDGFAAQLARGRITPPEDLTAGFPAPASMPEAGSPRAATSAGSGPKPSDTSAPADQAMTELLTVQLLGNTVVRLGDRLLTAPDWGYAKPRELLLLLVSFPPQSKDQIGEALWPGLSGKQLRNAFHTALRDLRRALGDPDWVAFTNGRYAINRDRDHLFDIEEFEKALSDARRRSEATEALPLLERAVSLYRGDFLPDLLDAEWTHGRRAELRRGYGAALSGAGRRLAAADRFREAADMFRRAVGHEPLDEAAHRHLMHCLIRAGEPGQAAAVYQDLARRLREELGVAPAAETTAMYRAIGRPA
jgi:predicted ATPase/DNA-binding SARP family transcriptional activator